MLDYFVGESRSQDRSLPWAGVTRDIPADVVAVGNPARVVKSL